MKAQLITRDLKPLTERVSVHTGICVNLNLYLTNQRQYMQYHRRDLVARANLHFCIVLLNFKPSNCVSPFLHSHSPYSHLRFETPTGIRFGCRPSHQTNCNVYYLSRIQLNNTYELKHPMRERVLHRIGKTDIYTCLY